MRRDRPALAGDALWLVGTALTVVVLAAVPALFDHRYYFAGDTQVGAVPQWFHLGTLLRQGHWPLLDPSAWPGGNYIAEGQWGLFSPITLLIALVTTLVPNLVIFVTVLKTGLLLVGAVGMYLLLRGYRTSPAWAYVGAVAITVGGATQYLESPSWVTGQMVWALLPWFWWAARRMVYGSANPFTALFVGFLVVTVGYVYGTMYVAVAIVACLLDAALARSRMAFVRVFFVGVLCAVLAVTVYLPGILTAGVTNRSSLAILSDGRLQADLPGVATSMLPTTISLASGPYPTHFIAWFLPAVLWVDWGRAREALRPLAGAILLALVMLAWALGPDQVGPIRWPIRVMPEVTIAVVLITVVLLSQALPARPSRGRLLLSLGWVLAAAYLVVSGFWTFKAMTAVSLVLVCAGLVLLWLAARHGSRGPVLVAVVAGLGCLALSLVQHGYLPRPVAADKNMPSLASEYPRVASTARGDMMLVGDPQSTLAANPRVARDQLIASSWYLTGRPVQSVYSTLGFSQFNRRYCVKYNGATCPRALGRLFSREPSTGVRRVDLLSVSTLHFFPGDFRRERLLKPPPGWTVTENNRWAVTWVRSSPVPGAGGVVWASPQTSVRSVSVRDRSARIAVGSVPTGGGRLVLSRLAWPGYRVTGARIVSDTDGYLLTLEVPASSAGETVTVSFSPPGWRLELIALFVAIGAGLLWSVLSRWRFVSARARFRGRPRSPSRGSRARRTSAGAAGG